MATSQLPNTVASAGSARLKNSMLSICLAALVGLSIAAYFWVDSRYPSLNKKLHAGKAIQVSGKLSFDALIPVTPQMPLVNRAAYTAVDWAWTNRIGMSFGVFFGAAVMTLLAYIPRRKFAGMYANTALGTLIGTPLGVCANCVAPIGRALYKGGASPATMLGAMISSPTLNVVVLAMTFALLPLPIALLRAAAPLVLLLLVPLIVKSLTRKEADCNTASVCPIELRPARAAGAVFKSYFVNLGRLALATVPWMLVAAVAGALMIELVPAQDIPQQVSVLGIVVVALLGTFAPMPIAFDIALAWILLSRGVPAPYVATLACTLGAFSTYPLVIVGRSLSWRVAFAVFAAVATVGIIAGVITALLPA